MAIQGGLGNQLFQWYFAHTMSADSHFRIDPLYKMTVVGLRNFELQPLMERCTHIEYGIDRNFLSPFTKFYNRILDSLWEYSSLRWLVEGLGYFREDPRIDQKQSEINLKTIKYAKGYFQKHAEIEKVFTIVEKELVPVLQKTFATLEARLQLGSDYTVLHVRRGDYEADKFTPIIIGTLSDEYFSRGLGGMDTSNLILLTENREDVTDLVKSLKPRKVLDKFDTTPWETLAIMYGASQLLGSNSSLSWWGARLCAANGGEVWLPSQWSYWKNIDPTDYHFTGSYIANVYWVQGNQLS
jgi:Glycosyl transferase family 11